MGCDSLFVLCCLVGDRAHLDVMCGAAATVREAEEPADHAELKGGIGIREGREREDAGGG